MGRHMRNSQILQNSRKRASAIMVFLQHLAESCRDGQDMQALFSNCKIPMVTSFELTPAPVDPVVVRPSGDTYTLFGDMYCTPC